MSDDTRLIMDTSTKPVQERLHEKPIISGSHPNMTVASGQTKSLKTLLLVIRKSISLFHRRHLREKEKLDANENAL